MQKNQVARRAGGLGGNLAAALQPSRRIRRTTTTTTTTTTTRRQETSMGMTRGLGTSCDSSVSLSLSSLSLSLSRRTRRGERRGERERGDLACKRLVIPSLIGDAATQPPPDLPSFLFKERIVYLGMTLVPSVTELLVAELLYLQFEDPQKPIYFYINSTGTAKEGDKMAYDAEAFAIYDTMSYVKNPLYTVCVGTAWGEAAMLLAAGEKGHRAALPSSTIMIKEPIAAKRGQASDLDLARLELREVRDEVVKTLSKHTERTIQQISEDIRRPIYMKPERAIEFGIIDKVLEDSF